MPIVYIQWVGQSCQHHVLFYYGLWTALGALGLCACVCVTSPRSGPNWRNLRELLGQWREVPMLPVVSTMGRSTPSYWSLGEWIRMAALCRMRGSWMSTLGGGGRWVVMNVWLVRLSLNTKLIPKLTSCVDSHHCNQRTDHKLCHVYISFQKWCYLSISVNSLAHPSWRCTTSGRTHNYCLEFGARANTSRHVWRMSEVGGWKVTSYSTKTSQNYYTRLWWAEHKKTTLIHLCCQILLVPLEVLWVWE